MSWVTFVIIALGLAVCVADETDAHMQVQIAALKASAVEIKAALKASAKEIHELKAKGAVNEANAAAFNAQAKEHHELKAKLAIAVPTKQLESATLGERGSYGAGYGASSNGYGSKTVTKIVKAAKAEDEGALARCVCKKPPSERVQPAC